MGGAEYHGDVIAFFESGISDIRIEVFAERIETGDHPNFVFKEIRIDQTSRPQHISDRNRQIFAKLTLPSRHQTVSEHLCKYRTGGGIQMRINRNCDRQRLEHIGDGPSNWFSNSRQKRNPSAEAAHCGNVGANSVANFSLQLAITYNLVVGAER